MTPGQSSATPVYGPADSQVYTTPRPYSPPRQPTFVRNATRPNNPQPQTAPSTGSARDNNLIGPVGYDVQ